MNTDTVNSLNNDDLLWLVIGVWILVGFRIGEYFQRAAGGKP